jgi:hypothetical protein
MAPPLISHIEMDIPSIGADDVNERVKLVGEYERVKLVGEYFLVEVCGPEGFCRLYCLRIQGD